MSRTSPQNGFIAGLLLALIVMGLWLRSEQNERSNNEAWRAEVKAQQAKVEKLLRDAENLRIEAAQQRALAEERAEELKRIRGGPATVPAAPEFPPPFVPAAGNGKRSWGPEQVTGAPDTPTAGDRTTAWASRTQDGQMEWLQLEYEAAVTVVKVKVYETYCPGSLVRVASVDDNGKETELWAGPDPTPMNAPMGVSEVAAAGQPKTKRIKVYLNSLAVPGWNEIDAVGLVDERGQTHWAVRAMASSSYADAIGPEAVPQAPVELAPREF